MAHRVLHDLTSAYFFDLIQFYSLDATVATMQFPFCSRQASEQDKFFLAFWLLHQQCPLLVMFPLPVGLLRVIF